MTLPRTPDDLQRRMNAWAPLVGAGIEVEHIAEDWSEIRVQMPLQESNANVVEEVEAIRAATADGLHG